MVLSSLLFINLTAAANLGADLHFQVFMFCNVGCRLELDEKCSLVSCPEFNHTCTTYLIARIQYSKVSVLGQINAA